MKMSVREARAQFAAALEAAQRGERITITRNGKPVAEIGPANAAPPSAPAPKPFDWEGLAALRERLGIEKPAQPLDEQWRKTFDDPAWTEELFGPDFADEEDAKPR